MRHIADHLECAVEQSRRSIGDTIQQAEDKADGAAEHKSGCRPRRADANMTK